MEFFIYSSWERTEGHPCFEVTPESRETAPVAQFTCEDSTLAVSYALSTLMAEGVDTRNSVIFLV